MLPISFYIWFFPVLPKADGGGGHQGTGLLSSCSAPPAGKTGRSEDLWPITSTRLVPSSTLGAWPAPMCCIPAPVCGEHTPVACSTAAVISVVEAPLQCMEACLLGCQILTTSQQNHKAQLNLNRFFSGSPLSEFCDKISWLYLERKTFILWKLSFVMNTNPRRCLSGGRMKRLTCVSLSAAAGPLPLHSTAEMHIHAAAFQLTYLAYRIQQHLLP